MLAAFLRIPARIPRSPSWPFACAPAITDRKKSALNQFQQTHDVKNLFVMDACGFPSNPCQNPTLTIMALCVRSCDYRSEKIRSESVPANPRRQKSICYGCLRLSFESLPESHAHHHGPLRALLRLQIGKNPL